MSVALITGAAKRIGRRIALTMARYGWDIIVHYHQSKTEALVTIKEIQALGRRALAYACDLRDIHAVHQMLPDIATQCELPTCIVNNASFFEYDTAQCFSHDCLARHMQINVTAPVLLAQSLQSLQPLHAQNDTAVVINLLDQKLLNPNPDYFSYTLSKAALQEATILLAQALAPHIRVVAIAPGCTLISGNQSEASFQQAHTMAPLGQSSTPDDIAQAVCFLARASAITGVVLPVDGGQHLVPQARDVMFLTEVP